MSLAELLRISAEISPNEFDLVALQSSFDSAHASTVANYLSQKNGFYTFESALHVYSADFLVRWNSAGLWRAHYPDISERTLFFAEDVFGVQFCLCDAEVATFDPETGDFSPLAQDLDQWARAILDDYEVLTGYPLAHKWQVNNGRLAAGHRLLPKIPFVMGGAYEIENLYSLNALEGMRFRADIANQIRDLPDGTQIEFKVVP